MRFMDGRNGNDELNRFLSIIALILLVIAIFTGFHILTSAAIVILIFQWFRMLSRNLDRREEENERFLDFKDNLFRKGERFKRKMGDKDHAYFKCPNCRRELRVPKGKGRISIHCPKCGTDFIKKT
jgi:predicted membrane protein